MRYRTVFIPFAVVLLILLTGVVLAEELPDAYEFAAPVFGLTAAPDGSLLVADAGAGIVELRNGEGSLVAELPGVSDMAAIGRGSMVAVTGLGGCGDNIDSCRWYG